MLIFNKDQSVREMCEHILTRATGVLFDMLEFPQVQNLSEEQIGFY